MEVIEENGIWIARSSYEERHVPKAAGFRWNPARKVWFTNDAAKAAKLATTTPEQAQAELAAKQAAHEAALAASRATDADLDLPVPDGLDYLPYQRAGIAFCAAHLRRRDPMPVTLTCDECAAPFSVIPYRAGKARYCSRRCKQTSVGRRGGAVRGAQMRAASTGKSYTKTRSRHTHRVVAEAVLGRALLRGEIVHHRDGNRLNNDPSNLEVISQSEHARLHHREMMAARKAKHGY